MTPFVFLRLLEALNYLLNFGRAFVGFFDWHRGRSSARGLLLGALGSKHFTYKPEWFTHRFLPIVYSIEEVEKVNG